ncbi:hypothetical protein ACFL3T_02590 [Patescibacteria group bacterium]
MGNSKNWLVARARNKQLIEKAKKVAAGGLISAVIIGPLIYFGAVAVPVELRNAKKTSDELVQDMAATPEIAIDIPATPEVKTSEKPIEFPEKKEKKEIKDPKVEFLLADLPVVKQQKEDVATGYSETVEDRFINTLKTEFRDEEKEVEIRTTKKEIEGQVETLVVMQNLDIEDGPRKVQKKEDADIVARATLRRYLQTNPKEADFDIYKDTSKLKNSKKQYQLVVDSIKTNNDKWYINFQQYKEALPVFDGNVKMIFTERKQLIALTDNLRTELPETTEFQISNISATESTKEIFDWDEQEDKIDFVNKGYYKNKPAFKVDVESHNPLGDYEVFVNAIDGEIENIGGDIRLADETGFTREELQPNGVLPYNPVTDIVDPIQYAVGERRPEDETQVFPTPEELELIQQANDVEAARAEAEMNGNIEIQRSEIFEKIIAPVYAEEVIEIPTQEVTGPSIEVLEEFAATSDVSATPDASATPEPSIVVLDTIFSRVLGKVYPQNPNQEPIITPLADAYVYYNSQQFTTDEDGYFENKDGDWYSVFLDGPYVTVYDDDASSNANIKDRTPEDPFIWDENSASLAATNAFYHANELHDYFVELHDYDVNKKIPITVNSELVDQYLNGCGAWFDNSDKSVEMGRGGTDACPEDLNYALSSDFIYHEYTHFIVEEITHLPNIAGSEAAAMGEGLADYFAASKNNDSIWGDVVAPNSTRNLKNTLQYGVDMTGESHQDGQIFAGALWDLRTLIGPINTDKLVFNTLYQDRLHFETFMYGLLIEDDDNNDFSDGTPHMLEIIAAFENHGIGPGILNFEGLPVDPEAWTDLVGEEAPVGEEAGVLNALYNTSGTTCGSYDNGTTIWIDANVKCYWVGSGTRSLIYLSNGADLYIGGNPAETEAVLKASGTLTTTGDVSVYGTSAYSTIQIGWYGTYYGRLTVGDELQLINGGEVDVGYDGGSAANVNTYLHVTGSTQIYKTAATYTSNCHVDIWNDASSDNNFGDLFVGRSDTSSSQYGNQSYVYVNGSNPGRVNMDSFRLDNGGYVNTYGYFTSNGASDILNGAWMRVHDSAGYFYNNGYALYVWDDSYFYNDDYVHSGIIWDLRDTARIITSSTGSTNGQSATFGNSSWLDLNGGSFNLVGTATFNTSAYADLDGGTFNPGTATFNNSTYVDVNGSAYFSPGTANFNTSAEMRHRAVGTASDGNVTMNNNSLWYHYGGTSSIGNFNMNDTSIMYAHGGTITATSFYLSDSSRLDKTYYDATHTGNGAITATNITLTETSRVTHARTTGAVTVSGKLMITNDAYYTQSAGTVNVTGAAGTEVLGTTYTSQSGMLQVGGGNFNSTDITCYENGWIDQNGGTITTSGTLDIQSNACLYDNDIGTGTFNSINMTNNSEIQNDGTINVKAGGVYMEDTSLLTNNYNTSGSAYIYMNEPTVGHNSFWTVRESADVENRTGGYITAQTGATSGDHLAVYDTATFTNRGDVIFHDGFIGLDGGGDADQLGGTFVNEYINGPGYVDFYGDLQITQGAFVNKSDRPASYGAYIRGNVDITGYYSSFCDISVLQNQGHMRVLGDVTMGTHTDSPSYSCSRVHTLDTASLTDNELYVDGSLTATEDYSEIYGTGGLNVRETLSMTALNSYIDIQSATQFETTVIDYYFKTANFYVGDTLNIGGYLVKLVAQTDLGGGTGTITIEHYPTYTFAHNATITGNYAGSANINEPTGVTYGGFSFNSGHLYVGDDLIINGTGGSAPYMENEGTVAIGGAGSITTSLQLNGNSTILNKEDQLLTAAYSSQSGNFTLGETVTGVTSGITAAVAWDYDNGSDGLLLLDDPTGDFLAGEFISGSVSGYAKLSLAPVQSYSDAVITVDTAWPTVATHGQFQIYNNAAVTNNGTINANRILVGNGSTVGGAWTNATKGDTNVTYSGTGTAMYCYRAACAHNSDATDLTIAGNLSIQGVSLDPMNFYSDQTASAVGVTIYNYGNLHVDNESTFTSTGTNYIYDDFTATPANDGFLTIYVDSTFDAATANMNLGQSGLLTGGKISNSGLFKINNLYMNESSELNNYINGAVYSYNLIELTQDYSTNDYIRQFNNYGYVDAVDVHVYGDNAWIDNENAANAAFIASGDLVIDGGEFTNIDGNLGVDISGDTYVFHEGSATYTDGELLNYDDFTTGKLYVGCSTIAATCAYTGAGGYVKNGLFNTDEGTITVTSTSGIEDMYIYRGGDSPATTGLVYNDWGTLSVGDATGGQMVLQGDNTFAAPGVYDEAILQNSSITPTPQVNANEIYLLSAAEVHNAGDLNISDKLWTENTLIFKNIYNYGPGDIDITGDGNLWLYQNSYLENYSGGDIDTTGTLKIFADTLTSTVDNHGHMEVAEIWNGDEAEYYGGTFNNESGADFSATSTVNDAGNIFGGDIYQKNGSNTFDIAGRLTTYSDSSTNKGNVFQAAGSGKISLGELYIDEDGYYEVNGLTTDPGTHIVDTTTTGNLKLSGFFGDPATLQINGSQVEVDGTTGVHQVSNIDNDAIMASGDGGFIAHGLATVYDLGSITSDETSTFMFNDGLTVDDGLASIWDNMQVTGDFNIINDGQAQLGYDGVILDNVGVVVVTGNIALDNTGITNNLLTNYSQVLVGLSVHIGGASGNTATLDHIGFSDGVLASNLLVSDNMDVYTTGTLTSDGYIAILDNMLVDPGGTADLNDDASDTFCETYVGFDGTGDLTINQDATNIGKLTVNCTRTSGAITELLVFGTSRVYGELELNSAMGTIDMVVGESGTSYPTLGLVTHRFLTYITGDNAPTIVFLLGIVNDLTVNIEGEINVSELVNEESSGSGRPRGGTFGGKGTYSSGVTGVVEHGLVEVNSQNYGRAGVDPERDLAYGGGKIEIDIFGRATVNGNILANGMDGDANTTPPGSPGTPGDAAGSGGSIILNIAESLSGSGDISANGGDSPDTSAAGTPLAESGGGGRVYIEYYDNSGYSGTASAYGGAADRDTSGSTNLYYAAPGTVFLKWLNPWANQNDGTLVIDNNNQYQDVNMDGSTNLTDATTLNNISDKYLGVESVQIDGKATLHLPGNNCAGGTCSEVQQCLLSAGSTLYLDTPGEILYNRDHGSGTVITNLSPNQCIATPDPPDTLYINNPTGAQSAINAEEGDPLATLVTLVPKFSAIHYDGRFDSDGTVADTGSEDPAEYYQLQIYKTDGSYPTSPQYLFDENATYEICDIDVQALSNSPSGEVAHSARMADEQVDYTACGQFLNTTEGVYYYRMRFREEDPANSPYWGLWSQTNQFEIDEGGTITITDCPSGTDTIDIGPFDTITGSNFFKGYCELEADSTAAIDISLAKNQLLENTDTAGVFLRDMNSGDFDATHATPSLSVMDGYDDNTNIRNEVGFFISDLLTPAYWDIQPEDAGAPPDTNHTYDDWWTYIPTTTPEVIMDSEPQGGIVQETFNFWIGAFLHGLVPSDAVLPADVGKIPPTGTCNGATLEDGCVTLGDDGTGAPDENAFYNAIVTLTASLSSP